MDSELIEEVKTLSRGIKADSDWFRNRKAGIIGNCRSYSYELDNILNELERSYNGVISRDSLIGDWENVLKESDGTDYLEDSHDSYRSSWSTAYRYSGRTGLARIDYNEISSKIDSHVNFNEEYNQRFRDFEAKLHAENE